MLGIAVIAVLLLLIIFWLVIISCMILLLYGSLTTRVPFVPVPRFVVDRLQSEMPLSDGDVFYDLGSGDGRVVLAMAKAFPAAKAIGVEKAPFPYLLSSFLRLRTRIPNAAILNKNFSKVSLRDATHLYMYLYPKVVDGLLPKLERELKPGTRVITCDFPFTHKPATQTIPVKLGTRAYTLYVYQF